MWKLKQANMDVTILKMFYNSVVLYVMIYCISLFHGALQYSDKSELSRICSIAQRIMVTFKYIFGQFSLILQ